MARLLILFSVTLLYHECHLLSVVYYQTFSTDGCRYSCETTDRSDVQRWSIKAGLKLSNVLDNGSNISIQVRQPNSTLYQSLCSMTVSDECGDSPNGTCCYEVSADENTLTVTANLTLSCLHRRTWEMSLVVDRFSSAGKERLDVTELFTGAKSMLTINSKVVNEADCIAKLTFNDVDMDYTCDNQSDNLSCQLEIVDCSNNMPVNRSSDERIHLQRKYPENSQVYFVLKKRARHDRNETRNVFVCKVLTGKY
ncbi:hypothetical protein Btru_048929 [Bulinus truncatus]|nr:hypothetical protein Btru_048929 [Bulinus truncatus]